MRHQRFSRLKIEPYPPQEAAWAHYMWLHPTQASNLSIHIIRFSRKWHVGKTTVLAEGKHVHFDCEQEQLASP
jgi:hypothetical protein